MANSLRVQATNEIMQITAVLLIQLTDPNTVLGLQPHFTKALFICEKTSIIQKLVLYKKNKTKIGKL
jgi:hypothetical protein